MSRARMPLSLCFLVCIFLALIFCSAGNSYAESTAGALVNHPASPSEGKSSGATGNHPALPSEGKPSGDKAHTSSHQEATLDKNKQKTETKPTLVAGESKKSDDVNSEKNRENEQDIMDKALELLNNSQEYWVNGDIENALEMLDQAYAFLLDADGDPDIARQKDDLRLLISKQ